MMTLTAEGRLAADPEMQYDAAGVARTHFRVACNYMEKGVQKVEYIRCTCWQELADEANDKLQKGDLVQVKGTLKPHVWHRDDGTAQKSLEMAVSGFQKPLPSHFAPFGEVAEGQTTDGART